MLLVVVSNFIGLPANPTLWDRIVNGVIGVLVAVAILIVLAFLYAVVVAPYEQRHALRGLLLGAEGTVATLQAEMDRRVAALEAEIDRLKEPPPAPSLRLDNRLETDTTANCFRLRVWNDSATAARPCAELIHIADENRTPLLTTAQMPLELGWTHQEGARPSLTSQDTLGQSVTVLCLNLPANAAEAELYVCGMGHRPPIGRVNAQLRDRTIYVTVAVRSPEHPNVPRTERIFTLRYNQAAPLRFIP